MRNNKMSINVRIGVGITGILSTYLSKKYLPYSRG
tara:strand:- start:462 stop:566 length:105 start_codon:yes stop_codon:yes gene_type:complete